MNVVITGASRGIGYETAKLFSQIENANVYAISRNRDKLLHLHEECFKSSKTAKIFIIPYDITSVLSGDKALIDEIKFNLAKKHIDILINNAGLLVNKPFTELDHTTERKIFETNYFSASELIRQFMPLLNSNSHIVNISSMGGFQGSAKFPGLSAYSASKAALACLTECLAQELKENNVSVNCLALGAVHTEMLQEAFPGYTAPLQADQMAEFIVDFAMNGHKYMNGKILPVSLSTP